MSRSSETISVSSSPPLPITIGVLALQGAVIEHIHHLERIEKVKAICVKTPEQLKECDGIIIPGGESTTISLLLATSHLFTPLNEFIHKEHKPVFGTCAGAIMVAEQVEGQKEVR